ncbi:protein FAM71B [Biomphalaria glabrata]|nr:protein FAM71B [Biomphalaria glabrata]
MVVSTVAVLAGITAAVATKPEAVASQAAVIGQVSKVVPQVAFVGSLALIIAAAKEGVALGTQEAGKETAYGVAGVAALTTFVGAATGAAASNAGGTVGSVATGAAVGSAIAFGTGVGTSASASGAVGLMKAGVAAEPLAWCVLGADIHEGRTPAATYTFDCWKQVVHDMSTEPSKGKLLLDVVGDPRVKQTIVKCKVEGQLPEIILQNIWDELFSIDFVMLSSQQLAAHAVRM